MKFKTILFTLSAFALCIGVSAQGVNNKNAKFKTFLKPLVPVKGVSTIGLKVHHNSDAPFTQASFKFSKLKDVGGNVEVKRYAYADYTILDSKGDLTFEIALDQIKEKAPKEMYTYKAPCVRDDGKLDKEDIMECDAYAYKQSFSAPIIMRVVNKEGEVVFVDEYDDEVSVKFGESDASPFLKKADLEAFFSKNSAIIKKQAYKEQLVECIQRIDNILYFMVYTDDFNIGTGKGKNYDYSKQEKAQEIALSVFGVKGQTDFSGLKEAVVIWEEELKETDLALKDAKVNRKVATVLHENLAACYMYLQDYDKAIKHVMEFKNLAERASNTAIYDRAIALKKRIFYFKRSNELNGDITVAEGSKKAKDFKYLVSANRKDKNYLSTENKYAAFKADLTKTEAEESAQKEEENATASAASSKKNPYRSSVMSSASQPPFITMNKWTHSSIMGQAMPDEIAELLELTAITANKMGFTSLPKNIGDLKGLTSLKLKENSLTEIPESIGNLKNLKTLDLTDNKLTSLPESIKGCTSLKSLKISGNNISADEIKKIKSWVPKKCKVK